MNKNQINELIAKFIPDEFEYLPHADGKNPVVDMNEADFEVQIRLHAAFTQAIARCTSMHNALLELQVDEQLTNVLWDCLKYSKYEGHKITKDLVNSNKELQKNYYTIKYHCVVVNLKPFLPALISPFKQLLQKMSVDHK